MNQGKIVFLCGVTSSGKTSIADAIQNTSKEFFYRMANDHMVRMVASRYLREDFEKYGGKAIYYMYHMAKLLSDFGENVLIDGCMMETRDYPQHYETVQEIFFNSPLYMVEVFCPLEICRERNIERGDRYEDQSEQQWNVWNKDVAYHLKVETHLQTPEECAAQILKEVFGSSLTPDTHAD